MSSTSPEVVPPFPGRDGCLPDLLSEALQAPGIDPGPPRVAGDPRSPFPDRVFHLDPEEGEGLPEPPPRLLKEGRRDPFLHDPQGLLPRPLEKP